MSLLKVVQLVCDANGCTAAYQAEFLDMSSGVEQRRKARTLGWRRSGGKDLCPAHVPRPFKQLEGKVRRLP